MSNATSLSSNDENDPNNRNRIKVYARINDNNTNNNILKNTSNKVKVFVLPQSIASF